MIRASILKQLGKYPYFTKSFSNYIKGNEILEQAVEGTIRFLLADSAVQKADLDVVEQRTSICQTCEHYEADSYECGKTNCGCKLYQKLLVLDFECPIDKF